MKHTNNLFKSFVHAYDGTACASTERNIRIHLLAASSVVLTGCLLSLTALEWGFVLSAIVLVLITEFINTCIERICDLITTDYSIQVKSIKDIAAASVVLSAVYALAIALLILYPKIISI